MTRPRPLLYKCQCGLEVRGKVTQRAHISRHPQFEAITEDLANRVEISVIRERYKLTRNQAAGLFARHWKRVRERASK